MSKGTLKTSERLSPEDICENLGGYLLYLRHLSAYEFSKKIITQDSFVLDVGFGEGYGTFNLSQYFAKVQGIDVNREVLEHASEKYSSENCFYAVYDGTRIPYSDNTFDAATSFQVIEHIPDISNYLSEIRRVLKPGGVFVLTTPNRVIRLRPNQKPWNRFHLKEYSADDIHEVLGQAFREIKISGIHGNEEIFSLELQRLKWIKLIDTLDFLKIRNLLPVKLCYIISKTLNSLRLCKSTKKKSDDFIETYSINNFCVKEEMLENSLDLLGICYK